MPSMGKTVNMLFKASLLQQSKHYDENRGVRKRKIFTSSYIPTLRKNKTLIFGMHSRHL